jgi:hypothetical protein
MIKGNLSQWITATTNIAVLLGVILLVVELRQNAELARVQMIQARINTNQQAESAFFDPQLSQVWVKSFSDPASMTLAEIRTMDAYLVVFMNQMMREYDLEQAGLLEQGATLKLMESNFLFLFGSPFAKAWWAQLGQIGLSPGFVETADPIVKSVEEDFLNEKFSELQKSLGAVDNTSDRSEK